MSPIYKKYQSKKRRETAARKKLAERPQPADGILKKWDDRMKHDRWKVVNPEAWTGIRETVFARCGGKCEGCGCWIWPETGHLHHWMGRGGGKRCDCPEHLQFLCPDQLLSDGTVRLGCHSEVHRIGKLGTEYRRAKKSAEYTMSVE